MQTKNKTEFYTALKIGITCIGCYMVRYYMANILSVTSPDMLVTGLYTKELLGFLSSAYMIAYAVGQLICGVAGDIIKPKKMVSLGMIICGLSSILFSFTQNSLIQIVLFGLMGFSLSMLRGPLVKTVSENTSPKHSRVICTFFSFAGFSGPIIASLISTIFNWKNTFIVAGAIAFALGLLAFIVFTSLERNNSITYTLSKNAAGWRSVYKVFALRHFTFYVLVGAIAEISATSISFWTPTYFTEHLLLSSDMAKVVYTATSIIGSVTPFITLFLFNLFKEKDIKMIRFSYLFASVFFTGVFFFDNIYLNVICLLLAKMSIGTSSSLLWSIYIPAQRKSGMVSTVNGVFDFSGYLFASAANLLFASSIESLGWNGIIALWFSMTIIGFIISVFTKQEKN